MKLSKFKKDLKQLKNPNSKVKKQINEYTSIAKENLEKAAALALESGIPFEFDWDKWFIVPDSFSEMMNIADGCYGEDDEDDGEDIYAEAEKEGYDFRKAYEELEEAFELHLPSVYEKYGVRTPQWTDKDGWVHYRDWLPSSLC